MRLTLTILVSVWASVYTWSLAAALWRRRNYRGGIGAGLLALLVLVAPTVIEVYVRLR